MRVRKISRLHLIGIIIKVADIINVKDIDYNIKFGTEDIDCFLGGLHRVDIKGTRDSVPIAVKLIIKWHSNPTDRKFFKESYLREHVFYNNIAPKLLEIQRKFKVIEGLRFKFLNCIYSNVSDDRETIVLYMIPEFKLLDRFQKTDLNHASLVIKNMAKLHALSFAMETILPLEFEAIHRLCKEDVQYSDPDNMPKSLVEYFRASAEVVTDPIHRAQLDEIASNINFILNKCTTPVLKYSVICHADCWNNNILFKYLGTGTPIDVLFVDYQLVRYASPVTDISYYLYMSVDQEILSKYYQQLIDIYYGTLSAVLRQCNLNVDDIYPRSIFEKQLKQYSVLGLVEALISMRIITAETEEALRMMEIEYKTQDTYQCETKNQSLYAQRVNGVVNDFFNRNYSLDAFLHK